MDERNYSTSILAGVSYDLSLKILLTGGLIEFKSNPSSIVTFYAPLDEAYTVNPGIIDRFIHSIAFFWT